MEAIKRDVETETKTLWAYATQGRKELQCRMVHGHVMEGTLQRLVCCFCLTVGLWVVTRGETHRDLKDIAEGLPNSGHKLGPSDTMSIGKQ